MTKSQDLHHYQNGEHVQLEAGAIHYADAIVRATEELSEEAIVALANTDKPVLAYHEENFRANLIEFYQSLLTEEVES